MRCNSTILCPRASVCCFNFQCNFENLAIFFQRYFTGLPSCSPIETFAAEFRFVRGNIVAAIGFTANTQPSEQLNFSLKRPGRLLSCFLRFSQQVRGKNCPMHLPRNCHQSFWIGIVFLLLSSRVEYNRLVQAIEQSGKNLCPFPTP